MRRVSGAGIRLIWITASGNAETCKQAGAAGYNLITHPEKSSLSTLARDMRFIEGLA